MKRRWLITLAMLAVVPLLAAINQLHPPTVPLSECSELYRRYADSPDIRAAYIKDYRVNDTITLCATVLEATTDTGWSILQSDFKIAVLPEEYMELIDIYNNVEIKLRPINHPELPMDTISITNNDIIAIARKTKTVCIFHTDNPEFIDAVISNKAHEELSPRKNECDVNKLTL